MSNHTPGPWQSVRTIAPRGWHIEANGGIYTIAIVRDGTMAPENEANARLIAEAGTVATETGLTPRQLAEQRAELLEELRQANAQMAMAADCIEAGRYAEALLHLSVYHHRRVSAIKAASGDEP